MTKWNFADIWEHCAEIRGDQRAQTFGDQTTSWRDFNRRANGVAQAMLDAGVKKQDKSAQYLYNSPPYMETVFASFKASLVPVNTNYRYADKELLYLWDNSDAAVITFHGTFVDTIERIRDDLPKVKLWLWVDDGSAPCPDWASDYESAASAGTDENVSGSWGRSGSDLWFLYTGGTTGMPKGVMWDQNTLIEATTRTHPFPLGPDADIEGWKEVARQIGPMAPVMIPGAPLMHGTGHISAMNTLTAGGCLVTLPNRHLDPALMLDTIEREKVTAVVIVGDAFARPIVDTLDAEPDRWDLSSVTGMVSSGVMWSQPIKERLLDYIPDMIIFDSLGSSEALGMGASYSSKDSIKTTAKFDLGENGVVIREDGELVQAGSGEIGRLGVKGLMPVGYYKDEVKTQATFPTINGTRYSLPGDWATIEDDGTITLLGRGSQCINTGGEKVFPEEVEEALKMHPRIVDAIAVGVPDDRFGSVITAVVEPTVGPPLDEAEIIAHVKSQLAAYKAPRKIFTVDSLTRAPNGKIDYKKWTGFAAEQSGVS